MKKTALLITLLILALAIGGYSVYEFWYKKPSLDIWQAIPATAIMVYESAHPVQTWDGLKTNPIWSNLNEISFYHQIGASLQRLDSLAKDTVAFDQLLKNKTFITSLHMVSKEAFDFLFLIKVEGLKDQETMSQILEHYKSSSDHQFLQRTYQDFTINEFKERGTDVIFSYILHENYFIGSFTPFLVEDVIRNFKDRERPNFKKLNPDLGRIKKLENDQGNLYLNMQKIPQFFSVFSKEKDRPSLEPLKSFSQSAFFDLQVSQEEMRLSGFTLINPASEQYLGSLLNQMPQPMRLKQVLPNRTALLYHFSFDNPKKWQERLDAYWKKNRPAQVQKRKDLQGNYGFAVDAMDAWMGTELGLAVLESINPQRPDRLVYIKLTDQNQALNQFNRLAESSSDQSRDSLYRETYAGREMREIKLKEFPAQVWGNLFEGFPQSYFLILDDYLVISNTIQGLKNLIVDIEREEVWGKSVSKNDFLETTLKEANLSVMVDVNRFWSLLEVQTTPKWQEFMRSFRPQLRKFDHLALQFSSVDDKFYSNLVMNHRNAASQTNTPSRYLFTQKAQTQSPMVTKPFVVRNHLNNSREVMVQDDQNFLYLISNDGRILWRDSLPGPIKGKVSQVDYFKNGKLQYLLATDKQIHMVDRTGQPIAGYPIGVPTEANLRNIGAIDYDNSKQYRWVVSDDLGNSYLYSKEGDLLDGWNPLSLPYKLIQEPQHLRVRGKDFIVAIQENGIVAIVNRRGEHYPGFPLDLKGNINSPLFVEIGTDFGDTYFTAITRNGELIKFNLNGSILNKKQFYKPNKETIFSLAADALQKDYVVARQTSNRVGILDRNEALILEKDYLTPGQMKIQYYYFSSGNKIFAVTDEEQQFTYLYDQNGLLINEQPIESSHEIGLMYFEKQNKYAVYSVYDRQFSLRSFTKE